MVPNNPYATDAESSTGYYKTVIGNATFAEIRRTVGGTLPAVIVYLLKLFGKLPQATFGIGRELTDVSLDEIPVAIREQLQGTFNDLEVAGFERAFALQLSTVGPVLGYNIVFSHPDSTCWASVIFTRVEIGDVSQIEKGIVVASMTTSGGFVSTTNIRRRLRGPDNVKATYLTGNPNRTVIDAHRDMIGRMEVAEVRRADLPALVRRISADATEYHINRGVMVRLTPEELERFKSQEDRSSDWID